MTVVSRWKTCYYFFVSTEQWYIHKCLYMHLHTIVDLPWTQSETPYNMSVCVCHTRYLEHKARHRTIWVTVSAIPVTLNTKRDTVQYGWLFLPYPLPWTQSETPYNMGDCCCHTNYLEHKARHRTLWLTVSAIPITLNTKRDTVHYGWLFLPYPLPWTQSETPYNMGECFCHTRYLDIKAIHHILWLSVSAIPVTLEKKRDTV